MRKNKKKQNGFIQDKIHYNGAMNNSFSYLREISIINKQIILNCEEHTLYIKAISVNDGIICKNIKIIISI
jgi:hypothetical protein